MNPYRRTKRSVDTLGLIEEGRLQFRLAGDGTVSPFQRRWRTVGGHVGWHEALLRYANLFLDAGLIDYTRPDGRAVDEFDPALLAWTPVSVTHAGKYLLDLWLSSPFLVVDDGPEAHGRASRALSAAYVAQSGLLEDPPHRYADALGPHARAVMDALGGNS